MPQTPQPPAQTHGPFRGHVEHFANGCLSGWAFDLRPAAAPATVHILVDRQEVAQVPCTQPRRDVAEALGLSSETVGFSFVLPESFFDGHSHQIALRFSDRSILPLPDPAMPSVYHDHAVFSGIAEPEYRSFVDGVEGDILRGWIIRRASPHQKWKGGLTIATTVDGRHLPTVRADLYRGDVAQSLGCDPACGFEILIPQPLYDQKLHRFHLTLVPDGIALEGSPLSTTLVHDALESRLITLEHTISAMHAQLTTLRRDVRNLIPQRHPNLRHYERWARRYYTHLREKVATERLATPLRETPLVSILCPVWRPQAEDFRAAIQSVLAQTYPHWELILVDDGGHCAETTAIIEHFCTEDPRIRTLALPENKGISTATNAGIKAAKGRYIAFFDHDDLLVDVALDVMIRAALTTGAALLYSDEDKIDAAGHFLEPNLKPDYNYRYLLGCNYICHLVMLEARLAAEIGPLESRYNGAQDHDFLLRAAEILPESAIHHVPEILYHWRKTQNSTASSISNKTYAVRAGTACVRAHLKRQRRPAIVTSIDRLSIYEIGWQTREHPLVSIIIPFRDQCDITRHCVECLLHTLSYPAIEIILVDNFSVEEKTLTFLEQIRTHSKITVLRVEEPFNYSRLNNLAAARAKGTFLLFLNNDVFITHKDFLTRMVKEALCVPQVGAVGARLLYPNGMIQHAGVAVGPEVIGVHTHRAEPGDDFGYIGRIRLSHDVTAVTGAAMLVRHDLFETLGGFDEDRLGIAFNDVDLCLKIRTHGWRIIYCAEAVAEHHESLSRGSDDRPEHEARFFHETQDMKERWQENPLFERDPAYPRTFTLERRTFFDLRNPDSL